MRFRPVAPLLAAALIVSSAACAERPSTASPDGSPIAAAPSAADNSAAVCEGVYAYAMTRFDDPLWSRYFDVVSKPEKFPPDRRVAIRVEFLTKQEKAVQALASEASNPQLRAALQTYADGWADLGAVRTPDGPSATQADWQPVLDLCPGIQERIFADLEAQGK